MCLQCVNDIDNIPRNHPNYERYVLDIRANCPYPYWKRLRDEARYKKTVAGHETRKSLERQTRSLQEQCFWNSRGGLIYPSSRSHRINIIRLRFKEAHGL